MGKYTETKKRQDLVTCSIWIVVGVIFIVQNPSSNHYLTCDSAHVMTVFVNCTIRNISFVS